MQPRLMLEEVEVAPGLCLAVVRRTVLGAIQGRRSGRRRQSRCGSPVDGLTHRSHSLSWSRVWSAQGPVPTGSCRALRPLPLIDARTEPDARASARFTGHAFDDL